MIWSCCYHTQIGVSRESAFYLIPVSNSNKAYFYLWRQLSLPRVKINIFDPIRFFMGYYSNPTYPIFWYLCRSDWLYLLKKYSIAPPQEKGITAPDGEALVLEDIYPNLSPGRIWHKVIFNVEDRAHIETCMWIEPSDKLSPANCYCLGDSLPGTKCSPDPIDQCLGNLCLSSIHQATAFWDVKSMESPFYFYYFQVNSECQYVSRYHILPNISISKVTWRCNCLLRIIIRYLKPSVCK